MLSKRAGAGSSASPQRNPLSIYVTNGIGASRDRLGRDSSPVCKQNLCPAVVPL